MVCSRDEQLAISSFSVFISALCVYFSYLLIYILCLSCTQLQIRDDLPFKMFGFLSLIVIVFMFIQY